MVNSSSVSLFSLVNPLPSNSKPELLAVWLLYLFLTSSHLWLFFKMIWSIFRWRSALHSLSTLCMSLNRKAGFYLEKSIACTLAHITCTCSGAFLLVFKFYRCFLKHLQNWVIISICISLPAEGFFPSSFLHSICLVWCLVPVPVLISVREKWSVWTIDKTHPGYGTSISH